MLLNVPKHILHIVSMVELVLLLLVCAAPVPMARSWVLHAHHRLVRKVFLLLLVVFRRLVVGSVVIRKNIPI